MTAAPSSFQIEGEFVGFFRDMFGKRRIVVNCNGEEVYLKIPKSLRHELQYTLHAGERVILRGTETAEPGGERDQRVVFQVSRCGCEAGQLTITSPIQVCAKKNCWRAGGKELWRELEKRIAEAGLKETVKLKAVDCLDRCKYGPNADIPGCEFRRCTPHDAAAILLRYTGEAK